MAVRPIRIFPDPVLAAPCARVTDFGPRLAHLLQDLRDTLEGGPGVGIAAPQIGVNERVAIVDVSRRRVKKGATMEASHGLIVLVNPEITAARGLQTPREGCLSVPDWLADVRRFETVTVRASDASGGEFCLTVSGFEALAVQHEVDHVNGRLFLDHVTNLKTDLIRRKAY